MTRPAVPPVSRVAARALVAGAVLALAGVIVGGRPFLPLYDGIVPVEPYRYLDPGPNQSGQPQGATATIPLSGGKSALVAVATPETVPQAQIVVVPGGLVLPAGTTAIDVSIAAVEPPALPSDGHIAGNVYAITVTNQAGAAASATTDSHASVELRAPDVATTTATVERFDGTAWQPVHTEAVGLGGLFTAIVTSFGDFAIVLPGPAETAPAVATGLASAEATPAPAAPSESATSAPAGPGGLSKEVLTIALGGIAVVIVVLVAVVALGPSRRPPPGRSGRGDHGGPSPGSRPRR